MKLLVFILVLNILFINATLGLHCYDCVGVKTNSDFPSYDCDKSIIKSCSYGEDYCLKAVTTSGFYEMKRCASSSEGNFANYPRLFHRH